MAPQQRPLLGILLMVLAMNVVPLMDGIAKHLASDYSLVQIVWSRFIFHALWLAPLVLPRYGLAALRVQQPGWQILRSLCILSATGCFFAGVRWLPITDVLSLLFVSPLIVTLAAALLFDERVSRARWLAVLAGFIGVLVVIRPGSGVFHWASLLGLGAGLSYACYILVTRRLSGGGTPLVTLFYTGLVGALVMTPLVPFFWTTPDIAGWLWLIAIGLIAAVGHLLLTMAFEHAPASTLAPLGYVEIIAATAIGWFAFGDFPDSWTWFGISIIIASGIATTWLTRREG